MTDISADIVRQTLGALAFENMLLRAEVAELKAEQEQPDALDKKPSPIRDHANNSA